MAFDGDKETEESATCAIHEGRTGGAFLREGDGDMLIKIDHEIAIVCEHSNFNCF